MHSATKNRRARSPRNISDAGPKCGSTKMKIAMIRAALTLAVIAVVVLITAGTAQGQTETVLYNFCSLPNCTDGANPQSQLTPDGAGNLYGTTYYGGTFGAGTVFELSPNGSGGWNETVLYSFTGGADGANPIAPVIFDKAGNLYGTTGWYSDSVVFELSPAGGGWTESVLRATFYGLQSGLMMDPEGNLYGIDGAVVFELSPPAWTYQVLCYAVGDRGGLTMDAAGNIFGVSTWEPVGVFELSPNGQGGWNKTVIYTFGKGSYPEGTPLVLPYEGYYEVVFGTVEFGGGKKQGLVYGLWSDGRNKDGMWFERNAHGFKGGDNGSYPVGGVVGSYLPLWGTTTAGGQYNAGIVFEIGVGWRYRVLWNFNGTDGAQPYGSLILDSAGNLYGTTSAGGANNAGVVFEVTP